jgi:hypothetical protein
MWQDRTAMGKVEEYREKLRTLDSWDAFLLQESRLPSPRANLELASAVASEGSADQLLGYAALDSVLAPSNTAGEFLAFCGVLGLGYLAARGGPAYLPMLRDCASDPRWRIREAVALGLQKYGDTSMERLLEVMQEWAKGTPLERRAVVASWVVVEGWVWLAQIRLTIAPQCRWDAVGTCGCRTG